MAENNLRETRLLMLCPADFGEEKANFFDSAVRKIFPGLGIQTAFLPNHLKTFPQKFLWIIRNRKKFDAMVGWQGWPVYLAFCRAIFFWRNPKLCLIPYRLYNPQTPKIELFLKRLFFKVASRGADLILALDSRQAKNYERELERSPGTTVPLRYGIDLGWFDDFAKNIKKSPKPNQIFCPGSAYRDDETFFKAIADLDVKVMRFQLSGGDKDNHSQRVGKARVLNFYNQPYSEYVRACLGSEIVVISVFSEDKPVGLTALLECMAYKKPCVITKGFSSNDYVKDGVTALEFKQGDYLDLREKIASLLDGRNLREKIAENAYKSLRAEYNLDKRGRELGKLIKTVSGQK